MVSLSKSKGAVQVATYHQKEDYYTKDPGTWFGKGAEELGLRGEIDRADFQAVAAGLDPRNPEQQLVAAHAKTDEKTGEVVEERRAGNDLTIHMSKSFSVLYAAAVVSDDQEMKTRLDTIWENTVKNTLAHVEANYQVTREPDGKGGTVVQQTDNVVIGMFRHATNRNQDVHCHTHAVIFNATMDAQGKWRANEPAAAGLYADQKLLSHISANEELIQSKAAGLSYDITDNNELYHQVRGVDEKSIAINSSRRAEIEAQVAEWKAEGRHERMSHGELHDLANARTKEAKRDVSPETIRAGWEERFSLAGTTAERVIANVRAEMSQEQAAKRAMDPEEQRRVGAAVAADREIERMHAVVLSTPDVHTINEEIASGRDRVAAEIEALEQRTVELRNNPDANRTGAWMNETEEDRERVRVQREQEETAKNELKPEDHFFVKHSETWTEIQELAKGTIEQHNSDYRDQEVDPKGYSHKAHLDNGISVKVAHDGSVLGYSVNTGNQYEIGGGITADYDADWKHVGTHFTIGDKTFHERLIDGEMMGVGFTWRVEQTANHSIVAQFGRDWDNDATQKEYVQVSTIHTVINSDGNRFSQELFNSGRIRTTYHLAGAGEITSWIMPDGSSSPDGNYSRDIPFNEIREANKLKGGKGARGLPQIDRPKFEAAIKEASSEQKSIAAPERERRIAREAIAGRAIASEAGDLASGRETPTVDPQPPPQKPSFGSKDVVPPPPEPMQAPAEVQKAQRDQGQYLTLDQAGDRAIALNEQDRAAAERREQWNEAAAELQDQKRPAHNDQVTTVERAPRREDSVSVSPASAGGTPEAKNEKSQIGEVEKPPVPAADTALAHSPAERAILAGIEIVHETESIFHKSRALDVAVKFAPGRHSANELNNAYTNLIEKGEVVPLGNEKGRPTFSTPAMIEMERENISRLDKLAGGFQSHTTEQEVSDFIKKWESKNFALSEGQRDMVIRMQASDNGALAVQGDPGTGKTTATQVSVAFSSEVLEPRGQGNYIVGMAYTGQAAGELASVLNRPASTVDKFLNSKVEAVDPGKVEQMSLQDPKTLFVPVGQNITLLCDESSFVGANRARQVLDARDRLESELGVSVKIAKIGDTKQRQSIAAGVDFKNSLEHSSADKVSLKDINRQRDDFSRGIARDLNVDDKKGRGVAAQAAMDRMQEAGKLQEVPSRELPAAAVSKYFALLEQPKQYTEQGVKKETSLRDVAIAVETNVDRRTINEMIRAARSERGQLGETRKIENLIPLNINNVKRGLASNWEKELVVQFIGKEREDGSRSRQWKGIKNGTMAEVVGNNPSKNEVSLRFTDRQGKQEVKKFAAHELRAVTALFQKEERTVSVGDKIVCLQNDKSRGVENGTRLTVSGFDQNGGIEATKANGQKVALLDYNRIDIGYASTVDKLQGASVDACIYVSRHATHNSTNVALTRGRFHNEVMTNSIEDFKKGVTKIEDKADTVRKAQQLSKQSEPQVGNNTHRDVSNGSQQRMEKPEVMTVEIPSNTRAGRSSLRDHFDNSCSPTRITRDDFDSGTSAGKSGSSLSHEIASSRKSQSLDLGR